MRDLVKQVITDYVVTLDAVAEMLNANPQLVYRWVTKDKVCEHLRIGRSHIVIDREDIPLIAARSEKSNNFKANRKAK